MSLTICNCSNPQCLAAAGDMPRTPPLLSVAACDDEVHPAKNKLIRGFPRCVSKMIVLYAFCFP
jgi:hypothetical protein